MNIDGAKVCESCGVTMEDVNMKQNQNDTGTKISNTGSTPGSQKKLPKNLIFGIAGAMAAFLIILIAVLAMNSSKVIDLNKYITFESSGYDGYGQASIKQ